jgi:hypothetical protein
MLRESKWSQAIHKKLSRFAGPAPAVAVLTRSRMASLFSIVKDRIGVNSSACSDSPGNAGSRSGPIPAPKSAVLNRIPCYRSEDGRLCRCAKACVSEESSGIEQANLSLPLASTGVGTPRAHSTKTPLALLLSTFTGPRDNWHRIRSLPLRRRHLNDALPLDSTGGRVVRVCYRHENLAAYTREPHIGRLLVEPAYEIRCGQAHRPTVAG